VAGGMRRVARRRVARPHRQQTMACGVDSTIIYGSVWGLDDDGARHSASEGNWSEDGRANAAHGRTEPQRRLDSGDRERWHGVDDREKWRPVQRALRPATRRRTVQRGRTRPPLPGSRDDSNLAMLQLGSGVHRVDDDDRGMACCGALVVDDA
jgi:hypothetical protein